jgi:hypothetical protein
MSLELWLFDWNCPETWSMNLAMLQLQYQYYFQLDMDLNYWIIDVTDTELLNIRKTLFIKLDENSQVPEV